VATSAMPIGIPGCPDLALCTASIAKTRIAFASSSWRILTEAVVSSTVFSRVSEVFIWDLLWFQDLVLPRPAICSGDI
ncbi:uncharacterized protein METZ01_LOCUS457108, partial [marine metagenome]